ncbi:hypothetical protein ACL02T_10045 [Pseudonocardia sp. RS010]|uniref:hypothetical protein n=1 Tax=Pseudonocardia sp. RS010 TaxID=3385979 RepID=UPI0039A358B0
MHIEVLVIPGCPYEGVVVERLRKALDVTGHQRVAVTVRRVTADSLSDEPAFRGSPTILIDGVDPFPSPITGEIGPACRVYPSTQATTGAPTVEQLRAILER